MSAVEALRDGDLARALTELKEEVRAAPDEPRHRIFLFQLLSVLGEWDQALTQLEVLRDMHPGSIAMVRTYELVIRCERLRERVFAGEQTPLIFGRPAPWMAQLIEAVKLLAQGDWKAAQGLRDEAFAAAPTSAGNLTVAAIPNQPAGDSDVPFTWLADADTRLGPILEVIANGCYYWVPIERISRIDIEPPVDLRDAVWLPTRFVWANQGTAVGVIPTRYPGSADQHDSQLQLARSTEWHSPSVGQFIGIGERVLATDEGEFSITNVRRIQFAETQV
jgi:type VI secretion system protein ImpE